MRDMVVPVPSVLNDELAKRQGTDLRMTERAGERSVIAGTKQRHPSPVKVLQQQKRSLDRRRRRVGERRPQLFVVGTNDRIVLGKRQFGADVGVYVAVGHVMNYLAHRPAPGTIGRIELFRAETLDRGAKRARRGFDA